MRNVVYFSGIAPEAGPVGEQAGAVESGFENKLQGGVAKSEVVVRADALRAVLELHHRIGPPAAPDLLDRVGDDVLMAERMGARLVEARIIPEDIRVVDGTEIVLTLVQPLPDQVRAVVGDAVAALADMHDGADAEFMVDITEGLGR